MGIPARAKETLAVSSHRDDGGIGWLGDLEQGLGDRTACVHPVLGERLCSYSASQRSIMTVQPL